MDLLELTNKLRDLSKDLFYESEEDYPFDIVKWNLENKKETIESFILKGLSNTNNVSLEVLSIDNFFKPLFTPEDWFEEEEIKDAKRYKGIYDIFKKNLRNSKVYKKGSINIDIFILGGWGSENVVGLHTKSIET